MQQQDKYIGRETSIGLKKKIAKILLAEFWNCLRPTSYQIEPIHLQLFLPLHCSLLNQTKLNNVDTNKDFQGTDFEQYFYYWILLLKGLSHPIRFAWKWYGSLGLGKDIWRWTFKNF